MKVRWPWYVVGCGVCALLTVVLLGTGDISRALGILIVAASVVASVRFPAVAWIIVVLSIASDGVSVSVAGLSLQPEVLTLPLLGYIVIRERVRLAVPGASKDLFLVWLGLTVWILANVVASLQNSPDPNKSGRIILLMIASLVAFRMVSLLPAASARWMIRSSAVVLAMYSVVVLGAWAVAQATGRPNLLVVLNYGESVYRTKGLMIEPNLFASLLVFWMCLIYLYREAFTRAAYAAVQVSLGAAAFLSFTRAAWIVIILLAVVSVIAGRRAPLKIIGLGLLGVLVIGYFGLDLLALGNSLGATFFDRITGLFDVRSGTGAYRVKSWVQALDDYKGLGHEFIGLGTNSFSQRHIATDSSSGQAYLGNFWIVLLHDSGLIGAAGFLIAFTSVAFRAKSLRALPLFVAIVVAATTTSPMWFAYPWIALAFVVLSARREDRIVIRQTTMARSLQGSV